MLVLHKEIKVINYFDFLAQTIGFAWSERVNGEMGAPRPRSNHVGNIVLRKVFAFPNYFDISITGASRNPMGIRGRKKSPIEIPAQTVKRINYFD